MEWVGPSTDVEVGPLKEEGGPFMEEGGPIVEEGGPLVKRILKTNF